jgi:hypothetical protein
MGRRKEGQERTWNTSTNRIIYQWSKDSKTKNGINTTKQTWTLSDPDGPHQNATEDRGDPRLPHIREGDGKVTQGTHTEKRKGGISEEGQEILEDRDIWTNETTLRGVIHASRKRERDNDDGVFMRHQRGPIISTFTTDWFLREGEGRELLGERMKLTSVRSQDQRRMLQANSHTVHIRSCPASGCTRLRRKRNQTDATYVRPSG